MHGQNKATAHPVRQILHVFGFVLCGASWCHGADNANESRFVIAPSEDQFVIRVQENPSTGYMVALKRMSEGIYFLYTDSPAPRDQTRLGAPNVRTFHFFNVLATGSRGEVVFARFQPFDFRSTYSEERYAVRIGGHGQTRPPARLGIYVVPFEGGLGVLSVQPGSIAHNLGIQPRDLVTHVNGQQVTSLSELRMAMRHVDRSEVSVRLRRRGRYIDLRTRL
jgi:predicted secreted protein